MYTVVGAGTVLWLLGAVALLVAHLVTDRPLGVWFATCMQVAEWALETNQNADLKVPIPEQ